MYVFVSSLVSETRFRLAQAGLELIQIQGFSCLHLPNAGIIWPNSIKCSRNRNSNRVWEGQQIY